MQVFVDKALINMGEIKRSRRGASEGVSQLRHRLLLMEWVVSTQHRGQVKLNFVNVGHLYIPKEEAGQLTVSDVKADLNIHVHYV